MDDNTAVVVVMLSLFGAVLLVILAAMVYAYKIKKLSSPTKITTTREARVPAHMWESTRTTTTTTIPEDTST